MASGVWMTADAGNWICGTLHDIGQELKRTPGCNDNIYSTVWHMIEKESDYAYVDARIRGMIWHADVGKALSCGNMIPYRPAATMLYSICTELNVSSSANSSDSIGGCPFKHLAWDLTSYFSWPWLGRSLGLLHDYVSALWQLVKLLTMLGLERRASPPARSWLMRPSVTPILLNLCMLIRSVKLVTMLGLERRASPTARTRRMSPSASHICTLAPSQAHTCCHAGNDAWTRPQQITDI